MTLWNVLLLFLFLQTRTWTCRKLDDLPRGHMIQPGFKPRQSKPEFVLLTARIYFVGDWYLLTPFVRRYQVSTSSFFYSMQNSSIYQISFFPMGCLSALFFPVHSGVLLTLVWGQLEVVTLNLKICLLVLQNNSWNFIWHCILQGTLTSYLSSGLYHTPGWTEAIWLLKV